MKAVAFAIALSALCLTAAHAHTPPPVEAFGRLPSLIDVAISPDGARLALARSDESQQFVQVFDIAREQVVQTAAVAEESRLRGVGWADDGLVTFLISRTFHPNEVLPGYMRFRGNPRRVDYYRTGVIDVAREQMQLLST